jgi:hypothetical protein
MRGSLLFARRPGTVEACTTATPRDAGADHERSTATRMVEQLVELLILVGRARNR